MPKLKRIFLIADFKNLFLNAYMGDDWRGSKAGFAKKVKRRATVIAKRRKPKFY